TPPKLTFDEVFAEVREAGAIFGVDAEPLVEAQTDLLAGIDADTRGLTALWYSSGADIPYVGAGLGAPQLVLDTVGLANVAPARPAARRDRVGAAAAARDHGGGGRGGARDLGRDHAVDHPQPARRPVPAGALVGRVARGRVGAAARGGARAADRRLRRGVAGA